MILKCLDELLYWQKGDDGGVINWSNRKRILGIINFLTLYWNPITHPNVNVIYIGAAPGSHVSLLSVMFPGLTFHCYDSRKFTIPETDKIKIYDFDFTDDVSMDWSNQENIIYISELYTVRSKKLLREAGLTEEEIVIDRENTRWSDMQNQQQWLMIINPISSLLLFHLPYTITEPEVSYLTGRIFFPTWSSSVSTDTWLVPTKNENDSYSVTNWNVVKYNEQLFYHNRITRLQNKYTNPLNNKNEPIDPPELLNDYDSTQEVFIIKEYLRSRDNNIRLIENTVLKISRLITMTLKGNEGRTLSQFREELDAPVVVSFEPEEGGVGVLPRRTENISSPPPISSDTLTPKSEIPIISIPKPTTSIPIPTTSIPISTTSIPIPTPSIPKPTTSIPSPTTSIPKPTPSIPKPTTSIPSPTTSIPKATTSILIPTTSIPKPTTSIPIPTPSIPKPTTSIPKATTSIPIPTTSIPKPTTSIPKPTTSIPIPTIKTQLTIPIPPPPISILKSK